jgi:2'-5' RNA ligase
LWPDVAALDELFRVAQKLQRSGGGRAMRRDNLHLTLVFLGDVVRENIPRLMAIAGGLPWAAFDLEFGTMGYWQHNRIVWIAPHVPPQALQDLVVALVSALSDAKFDFDHRPYVPHVTLLRDTRSPTALPKLAFEWPVQNFALVEAVREERGPDYRVLARWGAVSRN